MNNLKLTLADLNTALEKNKIRFLLTRFNTVSVSDLDILVDSKDFNPAISLMQSLGYEIQSHDHALGGRKKGFQINLVKPQRIQVDLHKDFTWRKTNYVDLDILWEENISKNVEGISVQQPKIENDLFLILINIIFEKAYITSADWKSLSKILPGIFDQEEFNKQAAKYHWGKTWSHFKSWILKSHKTKFPIFLPITLVFYSYWEKLIGDKHVDLRSLIYYIFFRARYLLMQKLPY